MFMKKILILLMICLPFLSYAQATPDLWRVHYTPNAMRASAGADMGDGTLSVGAALRDELRLFQNDHDNNLHAYLRGYLTGVKLGNGEFTASLNLRASTDTSGRIKDTEYNFLYDSLDSARGDDSWNLRLYNAFLVFDQVIPYTKVSAGRVYIDYLSDLQIDGGTVRLGTDRFNGYAYYGLPASYYISDMGTQVVGGGIEANPVSALKLRGEITQFLDEDDEYSEQSVEGGPDTLLWKGRGDFTFNAGFINGTLYAEGGQLQGAWIYEAGTFGTIAGSKTVYNISFSGQYENNEEALSMAISDFDLVNGTQSEFWQVKARIYQPIAERFAIGAGYEMRDNADTFYGDRDYHRVSGNVDLIELFAGNFISLIADWWYVPAEGEYKENKRLYLGGRASQVFSDVVELSVGAGMTNYRYYYKQYDKLPTLAARENNKLDNSVYIAYVSISYMPLENLLLQLNYTYEASQVIKEFDSNRETISTCSALASYNF
jgi:hypothetical protein